MVSDHMGMASLYPVMPASTGHSLPHMVQMALQKRRETINEEKLRFSSTLPMRYVRLSL